MTHWISAAEAALEGRASDHDVEVIERHRPSILDSVGMRALVAPFFAAFMWSAAVLRETHTGHPLDPLALFLRLLALSLTVRALLLGVQLVRRWRIALSTQRYGLALTPEGLVYRSPQADVAVPREDILDLREHGDWRGRSGSRWGTVYVVTHPRSGRLYLALPPVFEKTPGVLAERLMRWLAPTQAEASPSYPPADPLPSKLWERAAAGERPDDTAVIPHGRGWLRKGPYTSMLLGLAVLDGFLRLPPDARAAASSTAPGLLALALGIVPLVWIVLTQRSMASRKGIALLLTPGELLMRTRAGVHRVEWTQVGRLEIQSRTSWSMLLGAHELRTLVIPRKGDSPIHYLEAFLAVPAEVVIGLCEAYRKGRVAVGAPSASSAPSSDSPES